MTEVVVVFKSGAVVRLAAEQTQADTLIGAFYSGWDQPGVNLVGDLLYGGGSPYRLQASQIAGIFVDQGDSS
ncbi:MAG: hypothetical protein JJ920_15720 [Roseitalea sp.]|jgi:hypothetical protein|nr:hypothetical protein [Roseitalea sp.]MBO6722358.1 hypothetical protein [Roseitalea sp.]MBO6744361.1 hypothetical protein [Roseitalea sp.]